MWQAVCHGSWLLFVLVSLCQEKVGGWLGQGGTLPSAAEKEVGYQAGGDLLQFYREKFVS